MIAALHLPDGLVDKQEWTVDDVASLPKDLRYELIDGRLILPSPTDIHNQIGLERAFDEPLIGYDLFCGTPDSLY